MNTQATTYSESARGIVISHARALLELARHGCADPDSVDAFHAECGRRETYRASEVLAWLGY
jgi:hypothetical protein